MTVSSAAAAKTVSRNLVARTESILLSCRSDSRSGLSFRLAYPRLK